MTEDLQQILDFHADDYGISKNSSNDIINLISNGNLNSISILPNMNTFDYAVQEFKKLENKMPDNKIQVTVHLNFMEGHCCENPASIPDLVDSKGYFKVSWGSLFKYNYNPFVYKKIRQQLKFEIIAQTKKCIDAGIINKENLRFDSHQHPHMIPLVFDALLLAVKELEKDGCKTAFIRNTKDPIKPYYKAAKDFDYNVKKTFSTINIVKCLILNFYSIKIQKKIKKLNLPLSYLCGVFFSGNMDSDRLEKVLPHYCRKPAEEKRIVELLFHPGSVLKEEITEEFVKADFIDFHLSQGRKIEYNSIIKLRNL